MRSILRWSVVAIVIAAATALLGAVYAPNASAHSSVVTSNPANGATLTSAPAQITLTFNSPLRRPNATVSVVDEHGRAWQTGTPVVRGTTVTQAVNPRAGKGRYQVRFFFLSADGHPSPGVLNYRVV